MPTPSDPAEAQRAAALQACIVLDEAAPPLFDIAAERVRGLFGAQAGAVSFLDGETQWFKGRSGFDLEQTEQDGSFCAYCIAFPGVLWVDDAQSDPRFHDNRFVAGPPHVRFYAGAPVRCPDGWRVGTVCVMDAEPKPFDPDLADHLARIAAQVSASLERLAEVQSAAGR